MAARVIAMLLALSLTVASSMAALIGVLWGFSLRCDDSCSTLPPWRNDVHAWQWTAMGWTSAGAFVAAVLFTVAIALRRWQLASLFLCIWLVVALPFSNLLDGTSLIADATAGWVTSLVFATAGVFAVVLTQRSYRANQATTGS